MALPGLLGHWIDRQLGTRFVFVLIGVILGFFAGMTHLLRMVHAMNGARSASNRGRSPSDTDESARSGGT
ncbi:MAG: AtpZ/AtpI family protein [Planctomycetota bacterium]